MSILYERWDAAGDNLQGIYGKRYYAQTFTVGNTGDNKNHHITSVKLRMKRTGSPGMFIVSIRAVDGAGLPTGPDLTSTLYDGDTLPLVIQWIEITLPAYRLKKNTQYALVVAGPDVPGGEEDADIVEWNCSASHGYGGGAWCYSIDWGVTWSQVVTRDFQFKEYGLQNRAKTGKGQNKQKLKGVRKNKTKLFGEETNRIKIKCERE